MSVNVLKIESIESMSSGEGAREMKPNIIFSWTIPPIIYPEEALLGNIELLVLEDEVEDSCVVLHRPF